MNFNNIVYTVWLSLACTPGSDTFAKLLSKFPTPEQIYSADDKEIAACIGSRRKDYNSLVNKDTERAERIVEFCRTKGVGLLSYFDDGFPSALKSIANPPVLLYYRGKLPCFDDKLFISIVGTRHLGEYGKQNAFVISEDLAKAGAVVVSGMAIGIDGVAHAAALAAGGITVAVIGSGIDVCYPYTHRFLAREIVKNGCVFTEYAPGTKPYKRNFPVRNRIISALSSATVVIEGEEKSGSAITAKHAFEQGRVVYALPGNVGNKNSEVTNLLLKNGAKPLTGADDIIRDFETTAPGMLNPFGISKKERVNINDALASFHVSCTTAGDSVFRRAYRKNTDSKKVKAREDNEPQKQEKDISKLSFDKKTIAIYKKIPLDSGCALEELVDDNLSLRDIMSGLLRLEIAGFVTMLPGDRVKRNLK
jgi:DNA processing protein